MATTDKIVQVDRLKGEVKPHRRFDDRDWKYIADFVIEEYQRRKDNEVRKDRERYWKEIDRQVEMKPSVEFKKLPDGTIDVKKNWMAEMELPLQAQALEVLSADARRMLFPDSGQWFEANVEMTDDYLEKVDFQSLILGDKSQIPAQMNQDNCDKLAEGFLLHCFSQYDHTARFDQINAEAFKYGIGVARGRVETKNVFIHEARGTVRKKQRIPVIVPCSIKNIYLDDTKPSMHSSTVLGPAHIAYEHVRFENIVIAANKGSTNPEDEDGGWMPNQLKKVVPDKAGYVQVMEMEGDIIIPRKTVRSVVVPGAIITVALGGKDAGAQSTRAVIRFRFRKKNQSSYLLAPYHFEGADHVYPASPLMKGRTVQIAATDALNRFLDAAMLKNSPPVGYDPSNVALNAQGGPGIYPTAVWPTMDPIKVYTEVGGDPTSLLAAVGQFANMYAELSGVLPARLGAQTRSHTTAYAKDAEIQRGATRTVDYVNATGHGMVAQWLDMAYTMGRDALKKNETISYFIDSYGGYVELDKDQLPENVGWRWFGAGGPQEKQQKSQNKVAALNAALQIEIARRQMQMPPRLDLDAMQDNILREGGWTDIDALIKPQGPAPGASPAPMLPGADQGGGDPRLAALQALSGGGG